MNKSIVTNLVALLLIVAGYFSPWGRDYLLSLGFFALSGAITNWLAVFMLFERVPLLYGSGVIPRHFEEIKEGLKELILREFFSEEKLGGFLKQTTTSLVDHMDMSGIIASVDLNGAFDTVKDEILQSRIGGMLQMFGGGDLLEPYRETFIRRTIDYLRQELGSPEKISKILDTSLAEVPTEVLKEKAAELVQNRLDELTPDQVKRIIQDMIRKHLGWLVVWGGVLGGLIGLLMALLSQFIPSL